MCQESQTVHIKFELSKNVPRELPRPIQLVHFQKNGNKLSPSQLKITKTLIKSDESDITSEESLVKLDTNMINGNI